MLTDRITRRFAKHHSELLAYMDSLEEMAHEISESPDPGDSFSRNLRRLNQHLEFMSRLEAQHEKEEERILIPLLESRFEALRDEAGLVGMRRVFEEHDSGQHLIKSLTERLQALERKSPEEPSEYYKFSSYLTDLVWHYRRHVWAEDLAVLSAAERVIPDSADDLWVSLDDPSLLETEPSHD